MLENVAIHLENIKWDFYLMKSIEINSRWIKSHCKMKTINIGWKYRMCLEHVGDGQLSLKQDLKPRSGWLVDFYT